MGYYCRSKCLAMKVIVFSAFDLYLTSNYHVCAGLEGRLLGFAG
jgi:hypothetical protein